MIKRRLGNSSLEVAPWALGGNVFGWTADEAMSFKILDAFVDAGLNLVDTADVYSKWIPGHKGGESETIIGNWLAKGGKRDKVIIATKLGVEMGPGEQGLSRAYMMREVERSLARLKTDYIDLYQAHRDDTETPMEETLSSFGELIKAGKVRAIGASNFKADRLAEALKVSTAKGLPRYESLQPWYNLYDRADFEGALADLCRRENVGVIPYFSLASGFLTGKYRSLKDVEGKPRGYRVKDMLNERGFRILKALDTVSGEMHATPAQVSLAWLVAHGMTAPIASATNLEQFHDLLGATSLKLSPEAVRLLDDASKPTAAGAAAETRTPPPSSR
ncbi:MAG TPA: aldo/keto reductase [Candidatus Acidoferrales bacterium]|nr:aldo/keto reductase [Candidatus Acidoferrales bacterium]